jgi:hypothetical protein
MAEPRIGIDSERYMWSLARIVVVAAGLVSAIEPQQTPNPHDIPVMDGEAGPCSVAFSVTDISGQPVYDARIRVHIEYGFAGVRRLDLEAATNVDGKTQFKGLPKKVKGGILHFQAVQAKREGSATYDPEKSCSGESDSIVLTEK